MWAFIKNKIIIILLLTIQSIYFKVRVETLGALALRRTKNKQIVYGVKEYDDNKIYVI